MGLMVVSVESLIWGITICLLMLKLYKITL